MKGNHKPSPMKDHSWGGLPCKKCGKIHKHGMKGKHHTKETKQKIHVKLKGRVLTEEHKAKLRKPKPPRKRVIVKVREFYKIPEDIVFFPVDFYEHFFARRVLIERTLTAYGLITRSRLRECPIVVTSDADRSEIPVAV